jgi:signal peptidase I
MGRVGSELQFLYPLKVFQLLATDMSGQYWQTSTILLVLLGLAIAPPGLSDPPSSADPVYSESFCLKIFEEVAEKARSGSWQISDRDRHILTQCRTKFPPTVNAQIPLPTAAECVFVVKTLVEGGLSKVKEIELPEEKVRSIERCDEVLKYYSMPSANMLPTLKPNQKIVVDKTSYQTQVPQRGDIIVFIPSNLAPAEPTPQPLTRRTIGLPGETVRIENGKVYINGKFYREDYLTQSAKDKSRSFLIPKNSYLVVGDNRNSPDESIVAKSSIVGKVVWHF